MMEYTSYILQKSMKFCHSIFPLTLALFLVSFKLSENSHYIILQPHAPSSEKRARNTSFLLFNLVFSLFTFSTQALSGMIIRSRTIQVKSGTTLLLLYSLFSFPFALLINLFQDLKAYYVELDSGFSQLQMLSCSSYWLFFKRVN